MKKILFIVLLLILISACQKQSDSENTASRMTTGTGIKLDYQINLNDIPVEAQSNTLNSLIDILKERTKKLGFSDINIYFKDKENEKHIVIELKTSELQKVEPKKNLASVIGKNITLEFKENKDNKIFLSTTPKNSWKSSGLTGQYFEKAEVMFDQFFNPMVQIKFNKEGAKLFEEITKRNINKSVGIFISDELISAPNVTEKIFGGTAVITGNFSIEEAKSLANDLNTGILPAPIILTKTSPFFKMEFTKLNKL